MSRAGLPGALKKLDLFAACMVALLAALAVSAAYAALHFGWFSSPWQLAIWLFVLVAFATFGLPGRGGQPAGIAHGKFATREDIDAYEIETDTTKPDTENQGIYLGRFDDAEGKWRTAELRYKGAKHLLCFGTPGANKSMGLVAVVLSHRRSNCVVVDLKGQLAAISKRKRATFGKTITLNPFGVLADELPHLQSDGWNPLLQLDPAGDDFEGDAYIIAEALIDAAGGDESGSSKFFRESALNLAAALIMWERYVHGAKANLCHLRATVCAPNEFDDAGKLVGGFLFELDLMRRCEHAAIRNVAARLYSRLTDAKSQGTSAQDVIDTFMASTRFLDDPRIAKDMKKGGKIDFAALHRQITTIYLILPPHLLAAMGKWLRLFVNLALAELYKNPPREPALPPVLFMLDEFGNVGRLSQILNAMNISRDYSLQLWMFLQNLGQLKASYSKEWASFFSGAGALTTFATADSETAEGLSKLFGNIEMNVPTETVNGVSMTPRAIPLIRPEDISRLGRGETISVIQPCPWPVRGVAPVYTQTPFADGLDPNPYYRG